MTITELSIKRPSLVIVFFSFLAVLGVFGFSQLKYELMPKMSAPIVMITTIYPGASPNEVETSLSKLIEDAVTGLDKVKTVASTSSEGRSFVRVEFDMSVDINQALQDAQRKVNEVQDRFPVTARKAVISKISFDEIPVLRMALKANMSARDLSQFAKDKIQPRISKTAGVGMVVLQGGEQREIRINIDPDKLKSFGLNMMAVTQAIKASNMEMPTGNIKQTDNQFVVRVAGKFRDVVQMRDITIGRAKQSTEKGAPVGTEIRLSDIAEVEDGIKEPTNIYRLNGIPTVGFLVQKQSDANTVDVSEKVRKELKAMEKEYANIGLKFDIAQDASEFTMASANAVKEDLGLAIILVAFVMLIFLHSLRNSIIVMVAIPSSLISTFFAMYIFDFSLNMMTLLAMSLVIGILVDDSIVVLENIHRHLEMGQKKKDASIKGRNEIGFAALSITLVDIVVFVPLALITGMIGNFLREYALVVVFSTMMSLLVSFTITPMLASRFSRLEHLSDKTITGSFVLWFERMFGKVTNLYISALKWSLKNGGKVTIMITIVMIASLMLIPGGFIGTEFMPQVDRGELSVNVELDPGASIENTNRMASKVERILADMPVVEKVLTSVGTSSEGLLGVSSNNNAELNITLVDKHLRKESTDDIGQEIKKKVYGIAGVKVRVSAIGLLGTTNRSPIQILVSGTKYQDVMKSAKTIADIVRSVEATSDVRLSSEEGKPELRIEMDRQKLSMYGLTINDVGQNLRIALTGDDDSKYRDGINEYDIRIQMDRFDRSNPETVANLSFMNNQGQLILLKQFANVIQDVGPTKLERENRMSSVNVFSQVFGKSSGMVSAAIREKLKDVKLEGDVKFEFTGEQKSMAESFQSLVWALLAGILFVYMIMVALYDSFLYPFVVLFSIPVAMVGALLGLALTMKTLSIYSILGIIMLVGLVAKNAILIVDRTNQMRLERGLSTFEALVEAGQTRLRPIIMTTFAMIFGMMPIAISTSSGAEAKSGLAVVLIGGLTSSMLLTLVFVPVVYQRMDKWKLSFVATFRRVFKLKLEEEPTV